MLTDEQVQAYLKASHKCPYCKSQEIEGGAFDVEADHVYQDIKCIGCGRTWTDEYTLSGITEVEPQPAEEGEEQ